MTLFLLMACTAGPGAAPSTSGGDTADDTGNVAEFIALPIGCTPGAGGADPLTLTTSVSVTSGEPGSAFMELVDVDIVGDLAYAVGQGGLVVGQLAAEGALTQTHRDPGMGRYHRVEVSPEGVFLSHRDLGIEYRELANLERVVARFGGQGDEGMAVIGERLYVANRSAGTVVYDVSDPAHPVEAGEGEGGTATWELVAAGTAHLYGADNIAGLTVIDISEPEAPRLLAGEPSVGGLQNIAVDGGYAYGAAGGDGVVVFDLGNPADPVPVAWLSTGGSVVSVAVENDVLWVADHEAVSAWDVVDPLRPTPIGWEQVQQFSLAVDAHAGGAVVGDWGYFESWSMTPSVEAPAFDTPLSSLRAVNGLAEAVITNRGNGVLTLTDALAERGEVWVSSSSVAPGESATLRVTFAGDIPPSVCIGTNDPDRPTVELTLSAEGAEPPIGEVAPDFSLPTTTGETVRLSEQLGSPVMLAYFATW